MTSDELFLTIAKKHLKIETLETRKSDSLDFHDVAVWSIKAALEAAYQAGRKSAQGKPKITETGKVGSSYKGTIEISYQDLVDIWGEPEKGDAYKTEAEWVIRLPKNKVITIYNYKSSRSYSDSNPPVTGLREWHVGGRGSDVIDILLRMMVGRVKLLHRAA